MASVETHADFYRQVETGEEINARLQVFLDEYRAHRARLGRPVSVLDVGCGTHAVLHRQVDPADAYTGVDVKPEIEAPIPRYAQVDLNEEDLSAALGGDTFDVVFCGEVLEHVFSPDRLLRQLRAVLGPDGLLILSTPNLAYWVNRLLLLAGISPLFVENSAEVKLGRRTRLLGQGNETQGHIRLFTHRAALDLIAREGFHVVGLRSVAFWNLPVDRLIARLSHKLAPINVYLLSAGGSAAR